jgi:type IV pilus assembly protein PilZ
MEHKVKYNIANEETYQDGQIIFYEGSPGDWIYVILLGSVEISKEVRGQKDIIDKLQPGDVFGELEFIGGLKRTATARAVGETTVGIMDRGLLEKEYNQLSGQFRSILETIVLKFRKMLDRAYGFTRRANPRIMKVLPVTYKDRQVFVKAYTANVSAGGFFIKTENPLIPGDQFLLKLQLPGASDPIQITCDVIWARKKEQSQPGQPPGMGVKLREISKKDYKFLEEYIRASGPDDQSTNS